MQYDRIFLHNLEKFNEMKTHSYKYRGEKVVFQHPVKILDYKFLCSIHFKHA